MYDNMYDYYENVKNDVENYINENVVTATINRALGCER